MVSHADPALSALSLSLAGVRARLAGPSEVLEELRRDFAWFESEPAPGPALELELVSDAAAPAPPGLPALLHRRYRAYDDGPRRLVLYADGAWARWDFQTRTGLVSAPAPARLRELAFLAVLSRAGEALEDAGLRRVHALGYSRPEGAGLVLMPEGGGKSVLSLALLRHTTLGLLSDDAPLIDATGRAVPWPLRLGFREDVELSDVPAELVRRFERYGRAPKRLVDVSWFSARVGEPAPVRWLLIGRRASRAAVSPLSKARAALALADGLVLGRGLAQMSEYMLGWSPARLRALGALTAGRIQAARTMLAGARVLRLDVGPDARENAALLASLR